MDHDQVRAALNDYVDGELTVEIGRAVAAHLRTCADCRREHAALLALREEAVALPRAIPPRRDLWPTIAARIGAGAEAATGPDRERGPTASARPRCEKRTGKRRVAALPLWGGLVAAALAAVIIVAGLPEPPGDSDLPVARQENDLPVPQQESALGSLSSLADDPAWAAGAMVAALEAETRPNPWRAGHLHAAPPRAAAAGWLEALRREQAIVARAAAELEAAYLANPRDTELARQLGRICALRAELDARAVRIQEIV
jgi:hypothetical protein